MNDVIASISEIPGYCDIGLAARGFPATPAAVPLPTQGAGRSLEICVSPTKHTVCVL